MPTPPERMWEFLDAFEKYLHAQRELPPLIDLAAIHYSTVSRPFRCDAARSNCAR